MDNFLDFITYRRTHSTSSDSDSTDSDVPALQNLNYRNLSIPPLSSNSSTASSLNATSSTVKMNTQADLTKILTVGEKIPDLPDIQHSITDAPKAILDRVTATLSKATNFHLHY